MKLTALTVLASTCTLSLASPTLSGTGSPLGSGGGPSTTFFMDISGFGSNDFQGSDLNETLTLGGGAHVTIFGIAWNVNLTTIGGSWASESSFRLNDQISLTPGFSDAFGVTNMNYNSGGFIMFEDVGLENIHIDSSGIFSIEFFESDFVDNGGSGDAIWEAGSILTFSASLIPTPNTLAALGLAGLIVSRRRRSGFQLTRIEG